MKRVKTELLHRSQIDDTRDPAPMKATYLAQPPAEFNHRDATAAFRGLHTIPTLTKLIKDWADYHPALKKRTPASAFMKFFEEIGELVKKPTSADEYADVAIMIFDLADMHGVDLTAAILAKLEVNKQREWVQTPMGTYQHDDPTEARPGPSELFKKTATYMSTSQFHRDCYALGEAHAQGASHMMGQAEFTDHVGDAAWPSFMKERAPNAGDAYHWYRMGYQKAGGT